MTPLTPLEIDRRDAQRLVSVSEKLVLLAHELETETTSEERRIAVRLEVVYCTNELMRLEVRQNV
jgi:hypothetical protein